MNVKRGIAGAVICALVAAVIAAVLLAVFIPRPIPCHTARLSSVGTVQLPSALQGNSSGRLPVVTVFSGERTVIDTALMAFPDNACDRIKVGLYDCSALNIILQYIQYGVLSFTNANNKPCGGNLDDIRANVSVGMTLLQPPTLSYCPNSKHTQLTLQGRALFNIPGINATSFKINGQKVPATFSDCTAYPTWAYEDTQYCNKATLNIPTAVQY
eukprot:m51a1_g7862 hypothetical protein (214) ;mRNA; r:262438-263742